MVSELAKGDWEDLRDEGLNPTLEDFDRLNLIAIRLKDGAETTCANFPRVGWAGDVPFFEPTIQAFAWYHQYAVRAAANAETETTLWAFALAHAREPHFFDALTTPEAIDKAASDWAARAASWCVASSAREVFTYPTARADTNAASNSAAAAMPDAASGLRRAKRRKRRNADGGLAATGSCARKRRRSASIASTLS